MPIPDTVHISVSRPCSQPWEQMTPCDHGRFCGRCQKSVIDFTSWTDAALYEFFANHKSKVCGRFMASQVGRHISLPPQPHSRLYQLTMAMGLTLLIVQPAAVHARPPMAKNFTVGTMWGSSSERAIATDTTGDVCGEVWGDTIPLALATVWLSRESVLIANTTSDADGKFVFRNLPQGLYRIAAAFPGLDSSQLQSFKVTPGEVTRITIWLEKVFTESRGKTVISGEVDAEYYKGVRHKAKRKAQRPNGRTRKK